LRLSGSIAVALVTAGAVLPTARAWAAPGDPAPVEAGAPDAPADGPARAAPEVVLEVAAAQAADSEAIAQVARELLGRLSVQVRAAQVRKIDLAAIATAPVAPPPGATGGDAPLARVWIDWMTPGRATLYLLDARRDRLLVRQVERPAGGEELAREELGHILETACEGLLAGSEVGVPRAGVVPLLVPPAPRPPVAVTSPPPAPEPARWQLAVLYEAATLAPQARLTHGPMLSLLASTRAAGPRLGLWGTAQLRLPVRADDETVGVSLQTGALRLLAAYEHPLSERAAVRVGVGGGADVVRATPEAPMPDRAVLESPRTMAFPVGRAALGLQLQLSRYVGLVGALAADVDVTGQRYVFRRASGEAAVLTPWLVRPAAALGLAFP
jgi:hypothetical protein